MYLTDVNEPPELKAGATTIIRRADLPLDLAPLVEDPEGDSVQFRIVGASQKRVLHFPQRYIRRVETIR